MPHLNNRAYQILRTEIQKCSGDDPLSQLEQKLLLEELEKLRSSLKENSLTQSSTPASLEELRKIVSATYPKFSEKALSAAAKANRSLGIWSQIRLTILVLIGALVLIVGTGGALGLAIILISQIQSIINQLEKVQNGTTTYQKAQQLLLSAQNKLKQLQPK
jgi:hypothetical protein